ncbi:hypothetical protein FSP39_023804 [Pinctada imbricata]|uniref:RLR CTR domain-containing protein n=1 Tax=Pinctada imbricata TaxID=66713 RepID=A0AA89C2Q5_PINIB|nr:hypothetical protein FSP39_023804 [Pinctada imbricata]
MDEAVREVLGMNDETVLPEIKRKQKEICENERRSKATSPNIPKFESCRYKMACKLCGKFEVDCDKIRSIDGKHHVLIDKNIWKCMKVLPPSSEKRIDSNIIKQGKIFGNGDQGCTHPLGSVFCYKEVRLPTLTRTSLVVKDTETSKTWELKKWEFAPFKVLPIEGDDLKIMEEGNKFTDN